jgi:hypothetical protein
MARCATALEHTFSERDIDGTRGNREEQRRFSQGNRAYKSSAAKNGSERSDQSTDQAVTPA